MGKSIQNDGAPTRRPTPRLILWMSFQLAIPRRGALQQSPRPLRQPKRLCSISFRRSRLWPVFTDRPPRLNNTIFPAAARLWFELMDEPVRPARGKADNTRGHFWPVHRLAPRARISSWPGATALHSRGRRYDCSLIFLSSTVTS